MLPVVARTTDDMLVLVPNSLRESAMALGTPRWKVTAGIVLKSAKTGLITGVLLAIARVAGETAPLLFTSLNSVYMPHSLFEPMSNLTVTIFNYAMSPYADWQQMAWGASLLITISVLGTTIFARIILREKK
jgi:phosphate transport system permease protein